MDEMISPSAAPNSTCSDAKVATPPMGGGIGRSSMNCVQVGRTLQRYLDGTLDDEARRRVAAHLAQCRRCGMDEQAYREISAALRRSREPFDPEAIARLRNFAATLASRPPDEEQP
jgi:anti-sigma factor RsiW